MEKLRILPVDGSVISRMAVLDAVNATGHGFCESAASNGSIALEWLRQCNIDVVIIDVLTIKKEGLELIRTIKDSYPETEIVIMNSDQPESTSITLDALKAGAMDFIKKPPEKEIDKRKDELKEQFRSLFAQVLMKKYSGFSPDQPVAFASAAGKSAENAAITGGVDLILIASSTGGPAALDVIFSMLPQEAYRPVLIVQHMPPEFTNLMASKLNEKYSLNISEGRDAETLEDGKIIIAPGGKHMTVEASAGAQKVVRLLDTECVNGIKPSADVLFQSVAKAYKGRNILAIILTGMGNDGTRGVAELKRDCNCYCITQSENTCVVYGMPKCVYDAGLSDEAADLENIAYRINQIASNRKTWQGGGKNDGEGTGNAEAAD